MSDPMTNTEVEDVLASIRRLVSDDKRPDAGPVQQPPSDRLVLTPSLRVKDEEREASAVSENTDDAHAEQSEETFHSDDLPTDEIAQDETTHDDAVVSAVADVVTTETDDTGFATHEDIAGPADSPDMEIAAFADEVTDTEAQEDMRDESVALDELTEAHVPEDWAEQAGFAPEADSIPDDDDADDAVGPDVAAPVDQSLSEKIAALETLVGKRTDQFEPDDPGTDAYAGTEPPAMAWEDADAEDETPFVAEAEAQQPPPEAQTAPAQLFSSEDDVLDEDALRELVSDIVREELQGALGERITRNVRKLVRREIHRALAAQDLE